MKLFKNPVVKIIIAVVLGLLVLNLEPYVEKLITMINPNILKAFPWGGPLVESLSMLIFSVLIILIINKGKLSNYGFTIGKNVRYVKIIALSFAISIVIIIVTGIVANILQSIFPADGGQHFVSEYSFLETVIFVWIIASICEEVFTRGLIQGYLTSLKKYGFKLFRKYISVPVFVSALFFGAMHIMLITTGMNVYMVFAVVISTFILGLIAGHYREKTDSLIPAIIVHMIFNISGTLLGLLSQFME